MTGKKKGQMTFSTTMGSLANEDVNLLKNLLHSAMDILDKPVGTTSTKLEKECNDNTEDIIEKLKNKRDVNSSVVMESDGPSFENIDPSTIVSDFNDCKNELQKVKRENTQLKADLELSTTKFLNSQLLITQLKKVMDDMVKTNKALKNQVIHAVEQTTVVPSIKQEPILNNEEPILSEDEEINIKSVLSEVTQLEDDYQDPMFQTQLSNTNSSPLKPESSPFRTKSEHVINYVSVPSPSKSKSPGKLKLESDDTVFSSPTEVSKRRASNIEPKSLSKRRLLFNLSKTHDTRINLSKNPKTSGPWYPEDFQLVKGYDKIDDNYGQPLDRIPSNTRFYYENQLEFIKELTMKKFNKITFGSQILEKFQFIPTQQSLHSQLITPVQNPERNLLNPHILNEFKFEINETNLVDYKRYYDDITKTNKVKRWIIDETPADWFRSEFPNTQDQIIRNEKRDLQSQRKALLRLFHSCFLVKNGVQCGMWKFRDAKLNELVSNENFQIDLNLFVSGGD